MLFVFILSIAVVVSLTFLLWFYKYITLTYYLWNISGPKPLPIIGNILWFHVKHPTDLFRKYDQLIRKYGRLFKFWIGPFPLIFTTEPDYIKEILINPHTFDKPWTVQKVFKPVFQKAFFLQQEKEWFTRRNAIASNLKMRTIKTFIPWFNEMTQRLITDLENEQQIGKVFNAQEYISRITLDSIVGTTFGIELPATHGSRHYQSVIKNIYKMHESIIGRLFKFWLIPDFIFVRSTHGKLFYNYLQNVSKVVKELLNKRNSSKNYNKSNVQSINETQDKCPDCTDYKLNGGLLDRLLTNPDSDDLTEDTIHDITFMFVSNLESSINAVCIALLAIAAEQDIQQKVYEEIYEQFGNSNRPVEIDDVFQLEYLDRVIKEIFRLLPGFTFMLRNNTKPIQLGDINIPSNTNFIISVYHLHRNPEWWDDPDTFNPDRFLPEHVEKRNSFVYMPFGRGIRQCPGYKYAIIYMKIIIINLLRKYKLRSNVKLNELEFTLDIAFFPYGGYPIILTRRTD